MADGTLVAELSSSEDPGRFGITKCLQCTGHFKKCFKKWTVTILVHLLVCSMVTLSAVRGLFTCVQKSSRKSALKEMAENSRTVRPACQARTPDNQNCSQTSWSQPEELCHGAVASMHCQQQGVRQQLNKFSCTAAPGMSLEAFSSSGF